MDILLPIFYIVLLLVQIVLFILGCRKSTKKRWIILCAIELLSCAGALLCMAYYDSLPGSGMMPGLTYFAEVVYSFFAAIAYGVNFFLSLAAGLVVTARRHRP